MFLEQDSGPTTRDGHEFPRCHQSPINGRSQPNSSPVSPSSVSPLTFREGNKFLELPHPRCYETLTCVLGLHNGSNRRPSWAAWFQGLLRDDAGLLPRHCPSVAASPTAMSVLELLSFCLKCHPCQMKKQNTLEMNHFNTISNHKSEWMNFRVFPESSRVFFHGQIKCIIRAININFRRRCLSDRTGQFRSASAPARDLNREARSIASMGRRWSWENAKPT